jgi:hypothetical protein
LPHTTGVAPLGPGIGALQATFSVRLKVAGRFFSVVEPSKFGPRHCAQFSARRVGKASKRAAAKSGFMLR